MDVGQRRFLVPPAKREALMQLINTFLTKGGTKRELASLAGKFVGIAPAVQLAPLYVRRLLEAMKATRDWESSVAPQQIISSSLGEICSISCSIFRKILVGRGILGPGLSSLSARATHRRRAMGVTRICYRLILFYLFKHVLLRAPWFGCDLQRPSSLP